MAPVSVLEAGKLVLETMDYSDVRAQNPWVMPESFWRRQDIQAENFVHSQIGNRSIGRVAG